MTGSLTMIVLGGIGAVVLFVYVLYSSRYQARASERLLNEMRTAQERVPSGERGQWQTQQLDSVGGLNHLVPKTDVGSLRAKLTRAGFVSSAGLRWVYVSRLVGLLVPIVTGLLLYHTGVLRRPVFLLLPGALGAFGFILPSLVLDRLIKNRQTLLRRGLPDLLDLLIVCLESGLGMDAAIQRVGDEIALAHPCIAHELQTIQGELQLGTTLDVAFRNCSERTGVDALRVLSTFLREARRFGSHIGEALRSHADMMRHEREQSAEEQANKAAVKILFPMLTLILPAVFVVLVGPAAIKIQEAFAK